MWWWWWKQDKDTPRPIPRPLPRLILPQLPPAPAPPPPPHPLTDEQIEEYETMKDYIKYSRLSDDFDKFRKTFDKLKD
jgi:hypothetical protein